MIFLWLSISFFPATKIKRTDATPVNEKTKTHITSWSLEVDSDSSPLFASGSRDADFPSEIGCNVGNKVDLVEGAMLGASYISLDGCTA